MIDKEREKSTRPRSSASRPMPRLRSEFDRLCDELGGPAVGVAIGVQPSALAPYCRDYSSHRVLPVLLQFQSDETSARRHWPWAAFAIGLYDYEIKERTKYSDEPTPDDVAKMLSQIESSARNLRTGLGRLQTLSYRLKDPPLRFAAFISHGSMPSFHRRLPASPRTTRTRTGCICLLSIRQRRPSPNGLQWSRKPQTSRQSAWTGRCLIESAANRTRHFGLSFSGAVRFGRA
jgi:hypothetical protein